MAISHQRTLATAIKRHFLCAAGGHGQFFSTFLLLFLVEVEELTGIYFKGAGELKDIVETDVLFPAFHFARRNYGSP